MSAGQDRYEERRRLQAENELLHEQKMNARLKREAEGDAVFDLMTASVMAFWRGEARLLVQPCRNGWEIRFDRCAAPEEEQARG